MNGYVKSGIYLLFLILVNFKVLLAQYTCGIYLGKSSTVSSDLRIIQPELENSFVFSRVAFDDKSFEFPLYYGLRAGYNLSPRCGLELEFIHAKIFSNPEQMVHVKGQEGGENIDGEMRLGDIVQRFSISHGMNFLILNLVFKSTISSGLVERRSKISLIGRLGIGPSILHTESSILNNSQEQYEINRPVFHFSFGGNVQLYKSTFFFVEYKATYVRVKEAHIAKGSADVDLFTHHFVSGISLELE